MRLRSSFLLPGLAALALLAACGDGPGKATPTVAPGQTAAPNASATTPSIPADFGPAPTLGGNILKITPQHAQKVTQASTRSPNPNQPQGLCAQVTFDGLPENAQWFRIAFDGAEVTQKLTWIVASQTDPKNGIVCYAPEQGFTVGKHSAAISVQDPRNPTAPTKQVVGWAFEVTP